jgi:hypothetical protein
MSTLRFLLTSFLSLLSFRVDSELAGRIIRLFSVTFSINLDLHYPTIPRRLKRASI